MSRWLDLSNNSNKLDQTYFKGFIDVNYGNIYLRNGNAINIYDTSNNLNFSINSQKMSVSDGVNLYDISNSNLTYIRDLCSNVQSQINNLVNTTTYIQSDSSNSNTVLQLSKTNSGGQQKTANIYGKLIVQYDASLNSNLYVAKNITVGKQSASSYALDVSGDIHCVNLNTDGYVGIGITNPQFPLDVAMGPVTSSNGTANVYFNYSTSTTDLSSSSPAGYSSNYSILSRGSVLTGGSVVATNSVTFSDCRIKTNIIDIDRTNAIEILRKIQPKQFSYKDKLYHGALPNYGFIAQDVETVMKYAVGKITKYIPNVFELCKVLNGNTIMLQNTSTKDFIKSEETSTPLSLKLFDEKNNEIITKIENIVDDKQFSVSTFINSKNIFVYGQEITDFRVVDKDAIFTIATAALKEFDSELEKTKNEVAAMKEMMQEMKNVIALQQRQIETFLSGSQMCSNNQVQ